MSRRAPIDPTKLKVGDIVEWVEEDNEFWKVKILAIRGQHIIVEYSWDKATFAPSSANASKYVRYIDGVETKEFLRNPKKKPMGKRDIDVTKLKVGDTVEWVEDPNTTQPFIWEVEVLDIRSDGIIVDSGYGKKALFSPNSEDATKYTLVVGTMEMDDYLRMPKEK